MKEELQGKLVEILTSMQIAVSKGADFAAAQLPDIAQQYVTYGRISHTFGALVAVVVVVVAGFAFHWAHKTEKSEKIREKAAKGAYDQKVAEYQVASDAWIRGLSINGVASRPSYPSNVYEYFGTDQTALKIASVGFAFMGFGGFIANSGYLFMVWFAPKVWLLKEIAGMLK